MRRKKVDVGKRKKEKISLKCEIVLNVFNKEVVVNWLCLTYSKIYVNPVIPYPHDTCYVNVPTCVCLCDHMSIKPFLYIL